MKIDTGHVRNMAEHIRAMCGDDEDLFLDMIEGETDALELMDRMIAEEQGDEALAEAIKAQITELKARMDRISARAKAKKGAMLMLLDAIGQKKLERPRATVSKMAGRVSVQITDETSIPSQLCTVKTITTPDKNAIKAQIEAGETVPGAELVRGDDTITMRTR
ncbi:siphovirus Gp157 family protein [Thioclava sp. DLFJ4-1]|uniref:siphovirus Gp157 family protein n=1 Tax=Thioclava sp. DLFJ4-1 TaxID=1915313 RepID=UPI0009C98CDB|nr:siphovirus Gp157 family protein [Thioclava sp. DLFJ4-1]OOY15099.1 hypothetical protein BMI85_16260 [Thioclava sp. DLFJ4-1]